MELFEAGQVEFWVSAFEKLSVCDTAVRSGFSNDNLKHVEERLFAVRASEE